MRETIGKYEILRKLGEGGAGEVYAARDPQLGRDVALKVMHPDYGDEIAKERMRREARAAAGISHPHICQVFEVGEEDGELYLAMELLEGEPLCDRVERGPLAPSEAIDHLLHVLSALEALHARGFVHRDLKPSNLFVTDHGTKLLDFGLALPMEDALVGGDTRLTQTGTLVGTPAFMAPEQWRGESVGPACDIFAVGALAFELLTGKPAFAGASPMEMFHAIVHEDPPALVGGPQVAALDRILQRAMAKAPEDRYASAAEMASELQTSRARTGDVEAPQARTITHLVTLPFRVLRPDPDTDFLCQGLPESVAASLSGLESLVVKPSLATVGPDGAPVDAAAVAREGKADFALAGTIMRAGNRLRITGQLLKADDGTVAWSEQLDAEVDDIFELQDDLTKRIVESLSIPLTAGDQRDLRKARAANPEAHEYYLRANQLATNTGMLGSAQDLYLECVKRDPTFAPAWARLGRTYRVRAKYGHAGAEEGYAKAEEAFRKALELDPDLPVAHSLFTYFQIEQLRDAPGAVKRLLDQAARNPSDPDIFNGLVVACRFCGLLDASVAADRRARRLDPGIRTSVAYTYWMRGDYEEAIRYDDEDMRYMVMDSLPMLGRDDELAVLLDELARSRGATFERNFVASKKAVLDGDRQGVVDAVSVIFDSRFEDPEGLYHLTRDLAKVGELDMALEKMTFIVEAGFHCPQTFERDPWLDGLRDEPDFAVLMMKARAGHAEAKDVFEAAGGDRLLVL